MALALIMVLVIVITLVIGVVGVVFLVSNSVKNKSFLSLESSLKAYAYIVSFFTLLAFLFGGVMLAKVSLSYVFGYEFSYRVNTYYNDLPVAPEYDEVITRGDSVYYSDTQDRTNDIVTGITLATTSGIIFGVHQLLLYLLNKKQTEEHNNIMEKAFNLVNLTIFSIAGIISIPAAIYASISHFLIYNDNYGSYLRELPGEALAIAIVVIPVWTFFALIVIRQYLAEKRKSGQAT